MAVFSFCGAADMVNVGVRNHNRFAIQFVFRENRLNFRNVISRIDNDRLFRGLIAENRAVAPKHSDRKNFVNHCSRVLALQ